MPSGAPMQRDPLHLQQFGEREFQPDGKHQEDDAHFRDDLKGVQVMDRRPHGVGADGDAGDHVAENQGLTQPPRQRSAQDRSDEDVRQFLKDGRMRRHSLES